MSQEPPKTRPSTLRLSHCLSFVILSIFVLLALTISPSAFAETNPPDKTDIQLLDQTDWVTAGKSFDMRLKVISTAPAENLEVVTTVYGAIHNRSEFRQSLDDKVSGSSIILDRHPLSDVTGPDGTISLSLPVQDATQKRFYIRNPGIYPARVDVRNTDTGDVLDHFVTHIIDQPQPPTVRMGVSTVLPVQSPQSLDPTKPFLIDDKGNSVTTTANALGGHPTNPVSLVAQPETLDRLALPDNDPTKAVVKNLAAAQGNRPVLQTTWAPVSASLYDKSLSTELDEQARAGKATLDQTFPNVVGSTFAATDTLDTNTVGALQKRGVDKLIIREQDLTPAPRSTTLTRPFVLSLGKGKATISAAQADNGFASHFGDTANPILSAHRLLSDLAVVWNDQPAIQRTVVVMPPRSWTPNAEFLETYLRGLENSPLLTTSSLQNLFATPVDGGSRAPLTLRLATLAKTDSQSLPTSDFTEQRQRLQALSSIAPAPNSQIDTLNHKMLLAERADLDNKGHKEWISSVKADIDKQLNGIHLPKERSIRLTARQGEMPITVQNDNGYPVRVRVRLSGNKLDFPGGDERTIDVSRQYVTERFPIVARTSGAFGVQVQLESPTGNVVLQKSEVTVRSTATTGVGVGLSIGATIFLVLWWIRSIIKGHGTKASAVPS